MDIKIGDKFTVNKSIYYLSPGDTITASAYIGGLIRIEYCGMCVDYMIVKDVEDKVTSGEWSHRWHLNETLVYKENPLLALIPKDCAHEYRLYQGLTESYNYCIKCDKKET